MHALLKLLLLTPLGCITVVFFFVVSTQLSVWHTRALATTDISDSPETEEIKATLDRAYELLDTPADWLDVTRLSEEFIDHPDYAAAVGAGIVTKLKAQISNFLGPANVQGFGYLTAIKSKIVYEQRGIELLKSAQKKAQAENRELTEAEWRDLAKQNGGEYPSLPHYELVGNQRQLVYISLAINGDKARAVYDEGVTGRTAILVRIDERWYVAGIF